MVIEMKGIEIIVIYVVLAWYSYFAWLIYRILKKE